MAARESRKHSNRRTLFDGVKELRKLVKSGQLLLVIGEGESALPNPAKVDHWWEYVHVDNPKQTREALSRLEEEYIRTNAEARQSRFHGAIRMLGRVPVIFTTNLDQLLEQFLWKSGNDGDKIILNQIAGLPDVNNLDRPVIVKLFGDKSYTTFVTNESRRQFETLHSEENELTTKLTDIFNSSTALFLGCDVKHNLYKHFIQRFVTTSSKEHYCFMTSNDNQIEQDGHLTTLMADMELWEFVLHLKTGDVIKEVSEIEAGQIHEISFLPTQRESYLTQQLLLEKTATEIHFHTTKVTNALTTEELLIHESKPSLERIFSSDPFGESKEEQIEAAMDAMFARRSNLLKVIENGTPVVATFLYQAVVQELHPKYQPDALKRHMALKKYAEVILQAKSVLKNKNSLELVIVDAEEGSDDNKRLRQETFAHIKLEGGVNEAICYADTATTSSKKVTTHLVVINGEEVAKRRNTYDTSVSVGWDPDTSLLRLLGLVIERDDAENKVLKKEVRRKLLSLHDVQAISSSNEYDTKSMTLLGKGSFGEVYKVIDRQGKVFALKMLKDLQEENETDLIENFQKEAESLEKISHPNIVKLEKVERQAERLFLKLEYVDGVDLRAIIKPRDGKPSPQPKEFVLRCATQVGEALKYLHANKTMHRDVKADNVMVTRDQKTFKLTDFGLARKTERTTKHTRVGTMRYMAPEVTSERYSFRADVYSYALLLIETIEGRNIFEDYFDANRIYQKKMNDLAYAPGIPPSCDDHGKNMVAILKECLKPHPQRASMEKALSILTGKTLKDDQADVQLLCLGTGTGTTTVLHGEPSSSMLLLRKGKPLFLVDVGLGVIRSYREKIGNMLPPKMFITHNHSDHAAELALGLILTVNEMKKQELTPEFHLYCGPEVQTKLMEHRFDEIYSAFPKETFSKFVTWHICKPGEMIAVDELEEFHLTSHKSQHSEVCYGFTLYRNGSRLFGFSADSGFNQDVYDNIFKSPMVIVDARAVGTYEHASFQEVVQYMEEYEKCPSVYVIGHGTNEEGPDPDKISLNQMRQGDFYNL